MSIENRKTRKTLKIYEAGTNLVAAKSKKKAASLLNELADRKDYWKKGDFLRIDGAFYKGEPSLIH